MVTETQILDFARQIALRFDPEQIILFGSQANGNPHADSDVDLLVLMRFEGKGAEKGAEILIELNPPFAVDLLVKRPEEVAKRLEIRDYFLRDVMSNGRTLYARRS